MRSTNHRLRDFGRDTSGAVAIIFGLTAIMLIMTVGLAVDGGRVYHANSKIAAAIDAAALAAAKGLRESNLTDAEVQAVAQKFFDENLKGGAASYAKTNSFNVSVDRNKNAVTIDVESSVPATFGQLAGISEINIPNTTVAMFDSKDIELALSLDMTGSMGGRKIEDLKSATRDLLDIMFPDGGSPNQVRVGFAPFAAGVNAGSYAAAATDNRSPDNCVYERDGTVATRDDAPASGSYMKVVGDAGVTTSRNRCPSRATIQPMTDDKGVLTSAVSDFAASGSTAGHLGTAWAWYMLSPKWAGFWPSDSKPAAYNDGKTIKAVVLMTDGIYNTYGGINLGDNGPNRTKSENDAKQLCTNMKGENVIVYTIGFQLNDPRAIATLKACANSVMHHFNADDGDGLRAAFRAIAVELNNLRITK